MLMQNLRQFVIGSAIFSMIVTAAGIAKAGDAVSLNHGAGRVQAMLSLAKEPIRKPSQKI